VQALGLCGYVKESLLTSSLFWDAARRSR